jgi:hypothetical protein
MEKSDLVVVGAGWYMRRPSGMMLTIIPHRMEWTGGGKDLC